MRATEILNTVMTLKLNLNRFYIMGDAVLVLYGIKKETEDINICISVRLFNTLRDDERIDFRATEIRDFYLLDGNPNIKVIVKFQDDFECHKIGDLYLEDIRKIKDNSFLKKNFLVQHPNYPKY